MLISFATEAIMFVEAQSGLFTPRSTSSNAYIFHGVVDLLVGCVLLWGAMLFAAMFEWPLTGNDADRGFTVEPAAKD